MRPLLLALGLAAPATAAAPAVHVTGWARPTVPGQNAAAAYLLIHNGGAAPDRLLAITTPAASSASVHQTSNAGGVSRMRPAGAPVIAPGKALAMAPGGLHVMLTGLKSPLRPGTRLPLTLRFQRAGLVRTAVPIQMSAPDASHAHH
jgi:copper(I)-binding protein